VNQLGGPLHVILHFVFLVLDDPFFDSAPATSPALGRLRLWLVDWKFRERSVGAVVDLLLLPRLLFALEADDGRLDPLVMAKAFLAFREVLF